MLRKLVICLLFLFLCSCTGLSGSSSPSDAQLTPSYLTMTGTLPQVSTKTVISIPSSTPIPFIKISSLNSGEYFIDYTNFLLGPSNEPVIYLSLYESDGNFIGHVIRVNNMLAMLSPNYEYVYDYPQLINLVTGEKKTIRNITNCGQASWSPDSKYLVFPCPTNDSNGTNITADLSDPSNYPNLVDSLFVYSLEDNSLVRITNNAYPYALGAPSWSSDGKMIAFIENVQLVGTRSSHDGIRLLNTICFRKTFSCWHDEETDFVSGPFSWSPNNQYVAGIYNLYIDGQDIHEVKVFQADAEKSIPTFKKSYPMNSMIDWIAWSPDGNQIAVSSKNGNFLITVDSGNISPLNIPSFYYWIKIP